jgi:hypothetical protein
MSLAFLLDEDHVDLADIVERWNATAEHRIDLVAVGDVNGPPKGTLDDALLIWAEEHDRILLTGNKSTMPMWLLAHVQAGRSSPGVMILDLLASPREILDYLTLASEAGLQDDFVNAITWIP